VKILSERQNFCAVWRLFRKVKTVILVKRNAPRETYREGFFTYLSVAGGPTQPDFETLRSNTDYL
jgi:hypothetical protein